MRIGIAADHGGFELKVQLTGAVKAPGLGDRRKAVLEDIAIVTGGLWTWVSFFLILFGSRLQAAHAPIGVEEVREFLRNRVEQAWVKKGFIPNFSKLQQFFSGGGRLLPKYGGCGHER
jgi:hypothetical protein